MAAAGLNMQQKATLGNIVGHLLRQRNCCGCMIWQLMYSQLTTQDTTPVVAFLRSWFVALHCHSAQPCRLVASARQSSLLCDRKNQIQHKQSSIVGALYGIVLK
jgi:hypothetical protein